MAGWTDSWVLNCACPPGRRAKTTRRRYHGSVGRIRPCQGRRAQDLDRPGQVQKLEIVEGDEDDRAHAVSMRSPSFGSKDMFMTISANARRHQASGRSTVLVNLAAVDVAELTELIVESWCLKAPKRVLAAYEDQLPRPAEG